MQFHPYAADNNTTNQPCPLLDSIQRGIVPYHEDTCRMKYIIGDEIGVKLDIPRLHLQIILGNKWTREII